MKHARKLTSLLLALVMVFALATTVFADEPGTTTTPVTGTITVDNPKSETTYTAYKIFGVTYKGDNYSYTIEKSSPWFGTVEGYAAGLTLTQVNGTDTFVVTITDDFSAPHFAAALSTALKAASTPITGGKELTAGTDGKPTATGLELGYYFVTSSSGALCSLDTTKPNVTIYDKNDMPFEKEVSTPSADVGQDVTFTITGEVPEHTAFTTYTYEITDTMSNGLTFKGNTIKVKIGDSDLANTDYTLTTVPGENEKFTFKLSINDVKKYTVGDRIVVTYDATVNDQAIAEISKNHAVLKYSNDPNTNELGTSVPQEVPVYTSKIVIDKYETGNENKKLPGAIFVLYKRGAGTATVPTSGDYDTVTDNSTTTYYPRSYYKYTYATATEDAKVEWVENQVDATAWETNTDGAATFGGLADGTYYLVETKAPAGYNQLTGPVEVPVNGATQLTATAKVENKAGTELPSTGGMGTTIFYVLGAVLVVGAGVLLVTKKRMSQSDI